MSESVGRSPELGTVRATAYSMCHVCAMDAVKAADKTRALRCWGQRKHAKTRLEADKASQSTFDNWLL
jgi:hypothetical protein